MRHWHIDAGAIQHLISPRFSAAWESGIEPPQEADYWAEPIDDEGGKLFFFRFAWVDPQPDNEHLAALMRDAGSLIDHWITERL